MIGAVIERERKRRGMTAVQLAKCAGIRRQTLYRIEAGERLPNLPTFKALCQVLGLDPASMLDSM